MEEGPPSGTQSVRIRRARTRARRVWKMGGKSCHSDATKCVCSASQLSYMAFEMRTFIGYLRTYPKTSQVVEGEVKLRRMYLSFFRFGARILLWPDW